MKRLIVSGLMICWIAAGVADAQQRIPRLKVVAAIKEHRAAAENRTSAANALRVQGRRLSALEQARIRLWLELAKLHATQAELYEGLAEKQTGNSKTVLVSARASQKLGKLSSRVKLIEKMLANGRQRLPGPTKLGGTLKPIPKHSLRMRAAHLRLELLQLGAKMHELEAFKHKMMARIKQAEAELVENQIHRMEVETEHAKYAAQLKKLESLHQKGRRAHKR